MKKLDEKNSHYISKLFRTVALFACYIAFGICRSIQGPTLLELQKQVEVDTSAFQIVFLLGAITFPCGNLLAGFLFDKIPASFLLFTSTLALAISECLIPFSPNISILAAFSAIAELSFGLLDTGANVYCLYLWGEKSGPYFNALHLSQGLGFMLAPVLASSILPNEDLNEEVSEELAFTDQEDLLFNALSRINISQLTPEVLRVHIEAVEPDWILNPVQVLYLAVGCLTALISIGFLPGIPEDKKTGSYDFPLTELTLPGGGNHNPKLENWSTNMLFIVMTGFFLTSHGLSFAYGHFLTPFSVKSSLHLGAQTGANLTSAYYAAQVVMRAINIILVTRVDRVKLLVGFMVLVIVGSAILFSWVSFWGLAIGTVIVGLGSGSLFPMGLLWIQGHMEISGKVTSIFCIATTLGAQLFRFPEGSFIDQEPLVHLYLLMTAISVSVLLFVIAFGLMKWREKLMVEKEKRFQKIKNSFDQFAKTVVEI